MLAIAFLLIIFLAWWQLLPRVLLGLGVKGIDAMFDDDWTLIPFSGSFFLLIATSLIVWSLIAGDKQR